MYIGDIAFEVEILDKPYVFSEERTYAQTARIAFIDTSENVLKKTEYAVVPVEDIYVKIEKGEDINLDNCYVNNFSLSKYRKNKELASNASVSIQNFSAEKAFFEAGDTIDFSFASFEGNKAHFLKATFGNGNLSFYKCKFGDMPVDFSEAILGKGHTNFQYVDFSKGNKTFEKAHNFGNLSFVNTNFGVGRVNFKETSFGAGNIEFQYAKFGKGDISFDKATFRGLRVDFKRVEFGDGKLDFRRTDFGNANVSFEETEYGKGRKSFRRAIFGNGNVNFHLANFGEEDVNFETAIFGNGNLNFFESISGELNFKTCHLNNYIDFRVEKCNKINLANTLVRDVIDFKTGYSSVHIKELNITGMRNLGKFIIDWNENKVESMIENQEGSTNKQKAEQFRILKEDFHSSGQYNDEDEAYVRFKRYELKHLHKARLEEKKSNAIWAYPMKWSEQLIFDKMGVYATNPVRVLVSMLITYVLFSFLYYAMIHTGHGDLRPGFDPPEQMSEMALSFYHSAITFLTIGYGDYAPWGIIRAISSIEGFVGLFMMSYFTVAFVRKILR